MAVNKLFSFKTLFFASCLFAVLAGLVFTFLAYFTTGFTVDELYSAACVLPANSFKYLFNTCIITDANPPLYILLLFAYNHAAFFVSELWLRLPSLILWLSTPVAAWFLFPKNLSKNTKIIFISFLFLSAYLMLFVTAARSYSLLLILSVCITFKTLDFVSLPKNNTPAGKDIFVYFLLGLAACFTHYYGAALFVLCCAAVILFYFFTKRPVSYFLTGLIVLLFIYSFWLVPNFLELQKAAVFDGTWAYNKIAPWRASTEFFDIAFGADMTQLVVVLVTLCGLFLLRKDEGKKVYLLFAAALYFLMYAAFYFISFKINIMQGRYFIVLLPSVYLLCAIAVAGVLEKYPFAVLFWTLLIAVSFVNNIYFVKQHYFNDRDSKTFTLKYMREYSGKKIYLFSNYQFTDAAATPLFSYYLKHYYKANAPFFNLNTLSEEARKAASKDPLALLYIPACTERGKARLQKVMPSEEIYMDYPQRYCLFTPYGEKL